MLNALLAVDGSIPADRAAQYLARLARDGAPVEVLLLNVQPEVLPPQTQGMNPEAVLAHRQEAGRRAAEIAGGYSRLQASGTNCASRPAIPPKA